MTHGNSSKTKNRRVDRIHIHFTENHYNITHEQSKK